MSHIVTIKTQVKDIHAIRAAQQRLGWETCADWQRVRLYEGEVEGWAINVPGWTYPIVATPNGELHYDNFGGHWGDQKHLNAFLQAYAIEKAKLEARRKGYKVVMERKLPNGDVKLKLEVKAP